MPQPYDEQYRQQLRDADKLTQFEITDAHLNLLRAACITWWRAEFGAPGIDPKRPYGSSDVTRSIAQIVEPDFTNWDDTLQDNYLAQEHHALTRLHVESGIALQIILQFGEYATGRFTRHNTWSNWEKATS